VQRFARYERGALLFAQGRYCLAADFPDLADRPAGRPHAPSLNAQGLNAQGPMNEFMTALMYRAHGVLSAALDEGRHAEGLTVLQSRLMAAIETLPGSTLESLLPELFLGRNAAENTVDELVRMGIVDVGPGGALTLSQAGQDRNHALLARARSIEARELSDIPQSEIASCRRVLSRLVERMQTV
jgi:DNA-binding MarR family transcriptional regulator